MFSRRHIGLALKVFSLLLVVGTITGFVSMNAGGRRLLSVQSGSMAPAIGQGDLVSVKSVPLDEIAVGDVITFVSSDKQSTITHRVVTLLPEDPAGNNVITKGDANPDEDAPIEASSVVGKVERSVSYLGHGLDFLRTWPGLILLIYIPAFIVVIGETRRLAAYYRSQRYVLPEWLARRAMPTSNVGRNLAIAGMVGLASLTIALPVRAALQSTAILTGNTISIAALPPEPEPEPEPNGNASSVSLRRVFIACEEGEDEATHVQIIFYNSSRTAVDVSDWTIKSGGDDLLMTLPDDTTIPGPGLYEAEAPIIDGISYSEGALMLLNGEDEQIDETIWEPHTRGDRACRITL